MSEGSALGFFRMGITFLPDINDSSCKEVQLVDMGVRWSGALWMGSKRQMVGLWGEETQDIFILKLNRLLSIIYL